MDDRVGSAPGYRISAASRPARATHSASTPPSESYRKSLYAQDWFDSPTERDVANILEDAPGITTWVRLQIGDLSILWTEALEYNPDFIAIDRDDTHWAVEVKMDKEMQSGDVQRKRDAARRRLRERRREGRHVLALPAGVRDRREEREGLMGSPERTGRGLSDGPVTREALDSCQSIPDSGKALSPGGGVPCTSA